MLTAGLGGSLRQFSTASEPHTNGESGISCDGTLQLKLVAGRLTTEIQRYRVSLAEDGVRRARVMVDGDSGLYGATLDNVGADVEILSITAKNAPGFEHHDSRTKTLNI